MTAKILSTLALKLLTEKVVIKVSLLVLGGLVKRTSNTLDDELLETVREALES